MDKTPGVLIGNQRVQRSRSAPRLRLLTEPEPGHRVFFGNLADLLLARQVPQIPLTSRPARFWDDVFVSYSAPWTSFAESMLLHLLLVVLLVLSQSRVWAPVKLFSGRDALRGSITYYPPTQSFPATGSRASRVRARSRVKPTLAHASTHPTAQPPAMPVTPQQKPILVTPPDIKEATSTMPNLLGSHAVTPMVPFSTPSNLRRNAAAGPSEVVSPPPQVDQAATRRRTLPQASVVGPAPELKERSSAGQAVKSPAGTGGLLAVPPPPSVQNAGSARLGSLSHAGSEVVPPPPSIQGTGRPGASARPGSWSGDGSRIIPPPPSMQGADNANARPRSLSADGSRIIPPPPSIQGAGNSDATARIRSLSADSSRIIPPPPSIQGAGNSGATAGLGSLSADGSRVIPPPPSMQGAGNSGAAARPGSLSADGSRVIPPPPSIQGAGNPDATARLSSLSADGSHVIPPPPSMQGAGNPDVNERTDSVFREGSQVIPAPPSAESASVPGASGPAKLLEPMDPLPDDTSSPSPDVHNENKPSLEDLPLGLLGVVWVPPGTSYFSNFEVLVAKRRVGKNEMQLIKLVYEFLPYQRRLSEYDLNNQPQRIIKLRVIPDPSCDESLGRMLQANGEPSRPATPYSELPAALRSSDLNAMLPCYRTNADDFRRAMSRAH